jgi:hypothetical protein
VQTIFDSSFDTSIRAFLSAAIVLLWRFADRHARPSRTFERVFDHFVANLALLGALVLTVDPPTRLAGSLLTLVIAGAVIAYGIGTETEALVLYPYIYAVVAVDIFVVDQLQGDTSILLYLSVSTIAAIVGLFVLHARYRKHQA